MPSCCVLEAAARGVKALRAVRRCVRQELSGSNVLHAMDDLRERAFDLVPPLVWWAVGQPARSWWPWGRI